MGRHVQHGIGVGQLAAHDASVNHARQVLNMRHEQLGDSTFWAVIRVGTGQDGIDICGSRPDQNGPSGFLASSFIAAAIA